MKTIHYAADEFVTGNDIADALVRLAEALAQHETSLAVDVPVRVTGGTVVPVSFLLGPASQLVAVPAVDGFDEVVDAELVEWMTRQAANIGRTAAHPVDESYPIRPSDEFDL